MSQEVVIYKKQNCHLCDLALGKLQELQKEIGFHLRAVDIEKDDKLMEHYGLMIPVVEIGGEVIQYGHIDEHVIKRKLQK